MAKELLKGNIAFAEAAVRAGVDAYFGYPITPQTEALEYLSHRMPNLGPRLCAGRKRTRRDQYGLRRCLHRTASDDLFLQSGRQPDDGRPFLHRRH